MSLTASSGVPPGTCVVMVTRYSMIRSGFFRPAAGGDLPVERVQRRDVDLGEGGEGLDDIAQYVDRYPGADGQRGLLQPLACLGAERVGAGQPLAVAAQGQEAVRF